MANTYTLLASNTLTSNTTSVTFSSITAGYSTLVLRCQMRSSDTSTGMLLTVNSQTSASYTWIYEEITDSGNTVSNSTGYSGILMQNVVQNTSADANCFAPIEIVFPNATSTHASIYKACVWHGGRISNTGTRSLMVGYGSAPVTGTRITTLKLEKSGGGPTFVTGSQFQLYGLE